MKMISEQNITVITNKSDFFMLLILTIKILTSKSFPSFLYFNWLQFFFLSKLWKLSGAWMNKTFDVNRNFHAQKA